MTSTKIATLPYSSPQPTLPIRRTRHSEWFCRLESRWGTGTVTRTITTLRPRSTGGFPSPRSTTQTLSTPSPVREKETSDQWKWSMDKHWGNQTIFNRFNLTFYSDRFYGNLCCHYTEPNITNSTRVSFDLRVLSLEHHDPQWKDRLGRDCLFKIGAYYREIQDLWDDLMIDKCYLQTKSIFIVWWWWYRLL